MPIKVQRVGKRWVVINIDTGHIFGTHRTQKKAQAQWIAMQRNGADMEGKTEKVQVKHIRVS